MNSTILISDDDPHIREVIDYALTKAGFNTITAENGAQAWSVFEEYSPDLIVLDVGMPEMDGLEVCRRVRRVSAIPILFLSARDEEVDRIVGLEIGGDDYVTKPFSPRELVARVNAILKRSSGQPVQESETLLEQGCIRLDVERRTCTVDTQKPDLTGTEFNILQTLMRRPGVVFTREQILDSAWADNIHVSDRTIDSHMRNLRSKLRQAGCGEAVRTVHGIGFQLDHCDAGGPA